MRWSSRLERRSLGGRFVRRSATLLSGAAVGQVAVFASTPFLARMYSPADFGVLAVFLACSGVTLVVAAFRFEQAILVPETDKEASGIVKAAAICVVVTTMSVTLAAIAGADQLAQYTSTPAIKRVLWLLPISVAFGGGYQIMVSWATRVGAFRELSRSKAALGISLAVSQLAIGFGTDWRGGLVIGVVVSWVAAILVLLPSTKGIRRVSDADAWRAAVRFRRFAQLGIWSSLLNRSALEIPSIALAFLYGPAAAGSFLLAVRIVVTPARLITESAQHVFINHMAVLKREAPDEMYAFFNRTLSVLACLAVPGAVLLALFGPWVFGAVLGEDWTASSEQVRLLAPFLVAMMLTQPVAGTLWLVERLELQLLRECARIAFVITAFSVAWATGVGSDTAVAMYVASMVAGYGLLLSLCRWVLSRYSRQIAPLAPVVP